MDINSRPHFLVVLALMLSVFAGCSSTFKLYVFNDTPDSYALRINQSSAAYALQPACKQHIPENLQRNKPYNLVVLDRSGKEHAYRLYADGSQLFVRLHQSPGGELEWDLSKTPHEAR